MNIKKDFPISSILWYKIGGITKFLLEVSNKKDILQALDFVKKNNISKVFVLGDGSNLLFPDEYYDGAVLRIVDGSSSINVKDNAVDAFAGISLDAVIQTALKHNLTGLEWAGGLPGTVGAAVRGNVGAFGGEVKDVIEETEALIIQNSEFRIQNLKKEELEFGYRSSMIKKNKEIIVISARFRLTPVSFDETQQAWQVYQRNIDYRNKNHPLNFPNSGSIFKNIVEKEKVEKVLLVYPDLKEKVEKDWYGKVSMGYLIKRLGFSGVKIGGAQVSEKHANFIVNLGNAKFTDVLTLIKQIQQKVEESFGFTPEIEIEIVD